MGDCEFAIPINPGHSLAGFQMEEPIAVAWQIRSMGFDLVKEVGYLGLTASLPNVSAKVDLGMPRFIKRKDSEIGQIGRLQGADPDAGSEAVVENTYTKPGELNHDFHSEFEGTQSRHA
jgi:hypothetical protein